MDMPQIEKITGERLRQLPLCKDIYNIEDVEHCVEEDDMNADDGGFMIGYLQG